MPADWPADAFREYLRELMAAEGIPDYAELSRRSDVSQTQLSRWKSGASQPSPDSLRQVARVLRVQPVALFLAAGLNVAEELELAEPDFTVLPGEIKDLIDLWNDRSLSEAQRSDLLRALSLLLQGIRADATRPPTGGKRSA